MPDPPRGEAPLRALSERFSEAERRIRALLLRAPGQDHGGRRPARVAGRRPLLTEALAILIALHREDFRGPVISAYLAAYRAVRRGGDPAAAMILAGSLAKKLDRGAQTTARSAKEAMRIVTADNVEAASAAAVVAHVDDRGTRWTLSSWAQMNTETIGRQATSRGLSDAIGEGGKVTVDIGECSRCEELFSGELVVGRDPLPPGHPSCTCAARAPLVNLAVGRYREAPQG